MLKFAALTLALFGGSYLALGPGRTVYSGVSVGLPIGASQKVTPDPGSIWSFHEEVTVPRGSTTSVPVLVDFDGNGVMDTEYPELRVMVTDIQAVDRGFIDTGNDRSYAHVHIKDSSGVRWVITPMPSAGTDSQYTAGVMINTVHFSTPLVLPVRSSLEVEIEAPGNGPNRTIRVNMIGRVVNLVEAVIRNNVVYPLRFVGSGIRIAACGIELRSGSNWPWAIVSESCAIEELGSWDQEWSRGAVNQGEVHDVSRPFDAKIVPPLIREIQQHSGEQ